MLDWANPDEILKQATSEQPVEQPDEFPGVNPEVVRGINLARQWATQKGIPLEVTETIRPQGVMYPGSDPNSPHYTGGAADLGWEGLQWNDENFNGIADHLESQGFNVVRDAHGTGPHVHFSPGEKKETQVAGSWLDSVDPEKLLAFVSQEQEPTGTAWLNNVDPKKLLSFVTESQQPAPSTMNQLRQIENYELPPTMSNLRQYDAFVQDVLDKRIADSKPFVDTENVDFMGTVAARSDGAIATPIIGAGLNMISSIAEANAEKDRVIKKKNPESSDPLWMKAARVIDDLATTPGSIGLDVINQFARPEAALGAATQHLYDVATGKTPKDDGLLAAGWRGFMSNESDTTPMFKDLGMSDTQAFWANLGRQVILDPMIVVKPVTLVNKAGQLAGKMGVTNKVMPIIAKMAKSDAGQTVGVIRDFIMGNRPTVELLEQMERSKASDIYKAEPIAAQFAKLQKGLNPEQRYLLNKAQQATDTVLPITPVDSDFAKAVLEHHKAGSLPQKLINRNISKDEAIASFLQEGEEVPRFLMDDRQWYLYQEALSANKNTSSTILVPDAITRSNYLTQLGKSGVAPDVVKQADELIDLWQWFNQSRFNDPMLARGIVSEETFARHMDGTHLKRANEAYNNPQKYLDSVIKNGTPAERREAIDRFNQMRTQYGSANKIPVSELIQRQNLSEETLKKMGLITNAEYNVMNTVKGSSKVLRADEYLESVAGMFGKTKAEVDAMETAIRGGSKNMIQLNGKAYGKLDGMYVPKNVADDVTNVANGTTSMIPEAWQKAVGLFKVEKLLDFPPIFRNLYSMFPMVNVFGDVPFVSTSGSPMLRAMTSVGEDLFKHLRGGKNTIYDKAKELGVLDSTWSKAEAGNVLNYEGEFMKASAIDKVKWLADKGMNVFASPDQLGRLIVFDHHLKAGKSAEEAAQIARRAMIDYAKAPTWVSFLAKSGVMPFARFPWLAGVETARALYERPASVTKYTKPFKGEDADNRNKVLPKYLRGKELVPIGASTRTIEGKETKVQEHIDANYMLPFFNEFYFGNPLTQLGQVIATGKNNLGMTIIRPDMSPEDKAKVYAGFIRDSFGPSITSSYGWPSKMAGAMKNEVDYKGRAYSPKDVALQTVGIKNVPVNYQHEVGKRELEMANQVRSIKSEMRRIESEYGRKFITKEQRNQSLAQYEREMKEIEIKYKEMRKAYKALAPLTKK